MRKIKVILLVMISLGIMSDCLSQTVGEMMDANRKVYELVEAYVGNSDLTNRYAQKANAYRKLFASQNTTVYMDHISWFNNSSRKDTTTLTNYCAFYEQHQGSFTTYDISDVQIHYLRKEGGKLLYNTELTKSYLTKQTDSRVVSRLVLHIEYNLAKRTALITRIDCKQKDSRLQPHFMANYIKEDNAFYIPNKLKVKMIDGETVSLDSHVRPLSAEVYKHLSNQNCATYRYAFISNKEEATHTISISTVKNAVGLEVGYVQPLVGQPVVLPVRENLSFGSSSYRNTNFHVGATYLRQLFAVNRHRLSFETGLGLEFGSSRFSVDTYQDRYQDVDADEDVYERLICVTDYKEKAAAVSLAVPAMVRYDYYVIPKLSLFAGLGIRGALAFNRPAKASFDGYYAGQYGPEYFNVLIDQEGYYNFGNFEDRKLTESAGGKMGWNLDALARIGAQYFFTSDNRWSAEVSVGYRYRFLSNPLEQDSDFRLSTDAEQFSSVLHQLTVQPHHFIDIRVGAKYNF